MHAVASKAGLQEVKCDIARGCKKSEFEITREMCPPFVSDARCRLAPCANSFPIRHDSDESMFKKIQYMRLRVITNDILIDLPRRNNPALAFPPEKIYFNCKIRTFVCATEVYLVSPIDKLDESMRGRRK